MGVFVTIALAVAGILLFVLPRGAMIGNMEAGEFTANATYGLLAVVLGASLIHRYRGRVGAAVRDALLWTLLGVGFVAVYAYRDALTPIGERIMAELSPGTVITPSPGVAEIARRGDGQFVVSMSANGVSLPFIFDTGASTVVLRAQDATRIGIDPTTLNYDQVVSTANGVTRAAETRIATLAVGSIKQTNVRVLVARAGVLRENLLGQNFLERLASYGVEGDRLILRGK